MNNKRIFAVVLASVVLSGCPDPKLPKKPPSIPEPKAVLLTTVQASVPRNAVSIVTDWGQQAS